MRKATVFLGIIAASILGVGAAGAALPVANGQPSMDHGQHQTGQRWHGHRSMELFRQLDLSEAQRASIRTFARENFRQMRPELAALRQKRMAFDDAVPGTAEYQAAANDLAHAEANAALARVLHKSDLRSKIYQTLTPAQKVQLATLRAQRKERRDWHRTHLQPAPSASTAS